MTVPNDLINVKTKGFCTKSRVMREASSSTCSIIQNQTPSQLKGMFRHITFRGPQRSLKEESQLRESLLDKNCQRGNSARRVEPREPLDTFDTCLLSGTLDDWSLFDEMVAEIVEFDFSDEGRAFENGDSSLETEPLGPLVATESPDEIDHKFTLSQSFDTVATEPSESALDSESEDDRERKITWSPTLHSVHNFGYEQERFVRILILLMDPASRKFEFLHIEFDTDKRLTVADTLKQLPMVSTNEILSSLEYSVLCMNHTEFIKILPLEHYNLIDGDVLLAIPAGHNVKKVKREASNFLQLKKIAKTMTRIKQRGKLLQRLLGSEDLAAGQVFVRQVLEEDSEECKGPRSKLTATNSFEGKNSEKLDGGLLHPDLKLLEEVDAEQLSEAADRCSEDEPAMELMQIDSINSSSFEDLPAEGVEAEANPSFETESETVGDEDEALHVAITVHECEEDLDTVRSDAGTAESVAEKACTCDATSPASNNCDPNVPSTDIIVWDPEYAIHNVIRTLLVGEMPLFRTNSLEGV